VQHAEAVVDRWRDLGEYLVTKYNDGYVQDPNGQPQEKGYPEAWLRKVLDAHPDRYRLPDAGGDELKEPTDY
jgi:hypothetical protein